MHITPQLITPFNSLPMLVYGDFFTHQIRDFQMLHRLISNPQPLTVLLTSGRFTENFHFATVSFKNCK